MCKAYKVVRVVNSEMVVTNLIGIYSFKKWARMAGHTITGHHKNPATRAELQDQPTLSGLCGPMYDGINHVGLPVIRYEDREANDRLSA